MILLPIMVLYTILKIVMRLFLYRSSAINCGLKLEALNPRCAYNIKLKQRLLWGDLMRVGEYCNRDVVVINCNESVKNAAELMRHYHVGDLVLLEKQNNLKIPIGIVTDRDLVIEVMAAGVSPESLLIRDIVTEPFNSVFENDSLFDALEIMHSKKIRRLPVINNDKALVGIITLDDFIEILAETTAKAVDVIKFQQQKEAKQRN
ncbi:CBS domain protein [Legionella gratiana]|uniref:CBS domain protein n=1 Tax=Legionella gratiana TaxID=45066 RepID=A0A378JBK5_9GAMM|nr:CBS domain-containing protein [Legionella gratiana]KTD11105.1 CBS domain protein [Legionella gratiana]STX44488.1 CBS domain protein [Legionella gratiana]